ncbi:MAG: beta-lactamase family protein [Sphingomonas sp.]|nr:beta-lactamase family protein [Sphingomonas sp.]
MRLAILCAATFLSTGALAAPLTPTQINAIDAAATKALATTGVPAASVAVVQDGKIVYAHAYGLQREGVPARAEARYKIASISKQFTAAALLLLAEDGKISLDDPVSKYLPDLTRANEVKVRQLLSHTSGYRDYWPQDFSFIDMETPTTPEHILDKWAKTPLDFDPGTRWQYSNTGYVAAGRIVEQVSGMTLLDFLKSRIFDRLGMHPVDLDTGLTDADPLGYHRYAAGPVRVEQQPAPGWLYAAGELAMSASDLARWDISVIDQSVMKPASYREQQTEVLLTSGAGTNYGLGVEVDITKGHRRISHGGEAVGYLSENRIYPDDRAAIVVLDNADFGNAQTSIADSIEKILFADAGDVGRAKAVFEDLRAGRIDRAQFTANGNHYFTPQAIADYRTSLAALGEPKSFERRSSSLRGGFTAESYTVDYGTKKLTIILRAEPGAKGRIEQFTVYPAD